MQVEDPDFISTLTLPDGSTVYLRPIRPSDSDQAVAFREKLSGKSLYGPIFGLCAENLR